MTPEPTATELELREQLKATFGRAYDAMRQYPVLGFAVDDGTALDEAAERIQVLSECLKEAELSCAELRVREGLSSEAAWCGGATEMTILMIVESLAQLTAELDAAQEQAAA